MLVNPYLAWPVSQGWLEGSHALPGGGPAIDYAIPYGTPLRSPDNGRVSLAQGGDSGLTVSLIRSDNSVIVLCHGSDFIVRHGDWVSALQPVMFSGNSGRSYGPHLHTYGLHARGGRWDWTRDAAAPAGGGSAPFPTPEPKPIDYTPQWASTIINIANQE